MNTFSSFIVARKGGVISNEMKSQAAISEELNNSMHVLHGAAERASTAVDILHSVWRETVMHVCCLCRQGKLRRTPVTHSDKTLTLSHRARRSKNFPSTAKQAGLRRLSPFEGR
ncbi:hypothetical protein AVEN_236324-1 [Araneus ventricosus]|uniref:Uncharacterized protein n=1 Tax=Araneus ventricosus TaxID=182803 RepID=A0A4Y2JJL1_ARAVE|nr:hypothetical protein AVEN_236324-1 [Araneus ventricosus]